MSEPAHRVAPPFIAPGAVLAGRFRLDGLLGSGGMAEVWRAFDLVTGRVLAVKLLRPQVAASVEAVQRLKREGEVLCALSHPAIVRVETYGQLEGGIVFLAMELLDGETLGTRMRRGRMEPIELAPIVAGTCAGLAAAHARGIVHRDLKPDNIFLQTAAADAAGPQVKLLDFGISKVLGGDRLTYTGEVLGTPRYMSPEQLGAEPDVDARVDIYALGVILYEAMAGKPPFLAASATDLIVAILHGKVAPLRSLRPDLPPAVEAVVMRAMARAREARYASAVELADAFLDAAGANAKARALPKPKVMRTQALGGAGGLPSVTPDPSLAGVAAAAARGADPGEALRPGTFSAFGAVEVSAVREATSLPYDATELAPEPTTRSAASTVPEACPHAAPPVAAAPAPIAHGVLPAAPAPGSSSMLARAALVFAGLLAGAVSMAIAIAALHFCASLAPASPPPPASGSAAPPPGRPGGAGDPASPPAPEPAPSAVPQTVVPAPAPAVDPVAAQALPHGVEPPPTEVELASVAGDPRLRRGHHDHRAATAPSEREPAGAGGGPAAGGDARAGRDGQTAVPAQWPGQTDPLQQAGRALAEGHPEECVDILDDVIARGATPFALKRRGDCLLRAGRRDEAIRDYQRFCRLAPDHPAVGSVREQLAGMGLTCP